MIAKKVETSLEHLALMGPYKKCDEKDNTVSTLEQESTKLCEENKKLKEEKRKEEEKSIHFQSISKQAKQLVERNEEVKTVREENAKLEIV